MTARPAFATVPPNSWPRTTGTLTAQECVLCAWCTSDPQTDTAPTRSSTSLVADVGDGDLAKLHRERLEGVVDDGGLHLVIW